jgi:cobalt-zinc-cadmium efflux system membrane fusion protein
VPGDAVQYIDEQPFVFARLEDDLFELRRITVGGSSGRMVAVAEGLESNAEIVVAHSFTLKSEFLKSRLGAGCVEH